MDPGILLATVPVTAIVMGIGSGMLKQWARHKEEMARIRMTTRFEMDGAAQGQFETLRQEVMSLRDTTTQYDMSVERSLEEIRHRLTSLESRNGTVYRPQAAPEEQRALLGQDTAS